MLGLGVKAGFTGIRDQALSFQPAVSNKHCRDFQDKSTLKKTGTIK